MLLLRALQVWGWVPLKICPDICLRRLNYIYGYYMVYTSICIFILFLSFRFKYIARCHYGAQCNIQVSVFLNNFVINETHALSRCHILVLLNIGDCISNVIRLHWKQPRVPATLSHPLTNGDCNFRRLLHNHFGP